MFENLLQWIKGLFNKSTQTTKKDMARNNLFATSYSDDTGVNIEAMICNKLSGIVEYESSMEVTGENARAKALNEVIQKFWCNKFKYAVADMLGNGGVFIIPNYVDGKIIEDVVPQNRVTINKSINGELFDVTVIAEKTVWNGNIYFRLTDHVFNNGIYTMRQKATTEYGKEVPLATVPMWESITEEYSIAGYEKLPIAYFKAPTSKRNVDTAYGVPITYGQQSLIDSIKSLIEMFVKEFEGKKSFIALDERLFDENGNHLDGIFKKLHGDDTAFWQEFNPTIRETSIINGLNELFELLEYGIGASRGILTKVESWGATATEIRAMQRDTAIIVNSIRKMIESQMGILIYGYDALMEHFSVTPNGEYEVNYDWDLSFLESTTETFNQLQVGKSLGVISDERFNMYITGNTKEKAQEELQHIKETQPTLKQLGVDIDANE